LSLKYLRWFSKPSGVTVKERSFIGALAGGIGRIWW